ncbi:DUF1565 domain-containing protein [Mariniphaga sediminis]|uniref:DUF1565 domain-containing protein n=1 Tax=Mariniphaga sediminis TaxID=1628158 RepID=A0A399CYR2_9BACT|nr:right-handed parallel beta-helix repeat-containing protein [Mariniphaga sediminis]RIH64467.1 DUF1565 domain-containing protein [Mariniphaga sediminis]
MFGIKVRLIIEMLLFFSFFLHLSCQSFSKSDTLDKKGTYYLSPDGDDNNPGTLNEPWKTLEKANMALKPGDTVFLREGTYRGIINPVSSGENHQQSITYQSEKPHGAILIGDESSKYIINMERKHFVTIDGFKMFPARGGFGYIKNCSHITLSNCQMEQSSTVYIQLLYIDSHYNHLLFNSFSKIHGDGCRFMNSGHNVIEGNSFSKIGHSPLNFYAISSQLSSHNIIRGNIFHNGWGRNFELFNPDNCLFENNIITNAFNGAKSADSYSKVLSTNSIFRNNFIFDNWGGVIASGSYDAKLGGKEGYDPSLGADESTPLMFVNSRVYNNTFANNPMLAWALSDNSRKNDNPIRSNIFKNNLFYHNGYTGDFTFFKIRGTGVSDDNLFLSNLFFGEKPGKATMRMGEKLYTVGSLHEEFPGQFINNIDADPLFSNFQNRCFTLAKGSPAIDAGRPLTKTLGSGSGTELYVSDALFFFDGFGIEGESGDIVFVGKPGNFARVLKADIENNLLILDRSLQWKEGDSVSLPYAGKAPDIGALQYGNTGILTVTPMAHLVTSTPAQEVTFSAIIEGGKGKVDMMWDFGDGNVSNKAVPRHSYKDIGDYVVRLKCKDTSGTEAETNFLVRVEQPLDPNKPLVYSNFEREDFEEWGFLWDRGPSRERSTYYPEMREDGKGQCMCVSTEGNNNTLATNIKLRIWDIDKYPYIKFSYRIPPGVPVGIWLRPWPSEERPERVCIGGSPANSSGEYINVERYKLIDDGEWHTIEIDAREIKKAIPGLNLLHSFEFETYGKSKEGQKFWFDDFSINPF